MVAPLLSPLTIAQQFASEIWRNNNDNNALGVGRAQNARRFACELEVEWIQMEWNDRGLWENTRLWCYRITECGNAWADLWSMVSGLWSLWPMSKDRSAEGGVGRSSPGGCFYLSVHLSIYLYLQTGAQRNAFKSVINERWKHWSMKFVFAQEVPMNSIQLWFALLELPAELELDGKKQALKRSAKSTDFNRNWNCKEQCVSEIIDQWAGTVRLQKWSIENINDLFYSVGQYRGILKRVEV